jgi:hypothetical protein
MPIQNDMPTICGKNLNILRVLPFSFLISDGRRLVTVNGREYLQIVCGHYHRMTNMFYTGSRSALDLKMMKK